MEKIKASELKEKLIAEHPELAAKMRPGCVDKYRHTDNINTFVECGRLLLPKIPSLYLTQSRIHNELVEDPIDSYRLWLERPLFRGAHPDWGMNETRDIGLFQSNFPAYLGPDSDDIVLGIIGVKNTNNLLSVNYEFLRGDCYSWARYARIWRLK